MSGGVDIGANINSAGFEVVSSGGTASSAIISGGTLEIMSGGSTGSGAVTFAVSGGGILQLDDSVHFGGLVAGFGKPDFLDLRDIAFTSATTLSWTQVTSGASASGTLTVSGGGDVANITLLGQYVVGQFTSASDGHGGMLVGDPPVGAQTEVASNTLAAHNT
jgi:autotransporter passenger strand-loop-strand repeat protein